MEFSLPISKPLNGNQCANAENTEETAHTARKEVHVPEELPTMLEQIAKAVLVVQPRDVYAFAVYFLETYFKKTMANDKHRDLMDYQSSKTADPIFTANDYKKLKVYKYKTVNDLIHDQENTFARMFSSQQCLNDGGDNEANISNIVPLSDYMIPKSKICSYTSPLQQYSISPTMTSPTISKSDSFKSRGLGYEPHMVQSLYVTPSNSKQPLNDSTEYDLAPKISSSMRQGDKGESRDSGLSKSHDYMSLATSPNIKPAELPTCHFINTSNDKQSNAEPSKSSLFATHKKRPSAEFMAIQSEERNVLTTTMPSNIQDSFNYEISGYTQEEESSSSIEQPSSQQSRQNEENNSSKRGSGSEIKPQNIVKTHPGDVLTRDFTKEEKDDLLEDDEEETDQHRYVHRQIIPPNEELQFEKSKTILDFSVPKHSPQQNFDDSTFPFTNKCDQDISNQSRKFNAQKEESSHYSDAPSSVRGDDFEFEDDSFRELKSVNFEGIKSAGKNAITPKGVSSTDKVYSFDDSIQNPATSASVFGFDNLGFMASSSTDRPVSYGSGGTNIVTRKDSSAGKLIIEDPNLAATLIQAMYKGYKTRKELFGENGKAFHSGSVSSNPTSVKSSPIHSPGSVKNATIKKSQMEPLQALDRETVEQAAVKIQSFIKGYLTRKDVRDFLSTLPPTDHRFDKLKKDLLQDGSAENSVKTSSQVTPDSDIALPGVLRNNDQKLQDRLDNLKLDTSGDSRKNCLEKIDGSSSGCDYGNIGNSGDYFSPSYSSSVKPIITTEDELIGRDNKGKDDYYAETRGKHTSQSHPDKKGEKENERSSSNIEFSDYLDSAATVIQSAFKTFIHGKKSGSHAEDPTMVPSKEIRVDDEKNLTSPHDIKILHS